jgi:hypothetical protein
VTGDEAAAQPVNLASLMVPYLGDSVAPPPVTAPPGPTTTTVKHEHTTTTHASRSKTTPRPTVKRVHTASVSTAPPTTPLSVNTGSLPAGLLCIRLHESHGNYADNTGNGYYGAYQYSISTWNRYKGYARADLAPPAVQDERAATDYNRGAVFRHHHWPSTSLQCGV